MAESTFRPIIIALLLTSLFAIALITGASMMQIQNDSPTNIINDSKYKYLNDNLTSQIDVANSKTSNASTSFENSSVSLTGGIPFISSIYNVWKVIKVAPTTMYQLMVNTVFVTILGNQATTIVLMVIGIILAITIIFAIVRLVSTGDGG